MKLFLTFIFVIFILPLYGSDNIEKADSLFQLRNKNFNAELLLADTTFINQAINIYRNVLENNPDPQVRRDALWKLLQAYYFKGQFGTQDDEIRKDAFSIGIDLGEKYVDQIPESAAVYLWIGIIWARWAEVSGIFAAAVNGVAGKIKYYAEKTIELDENYLDAGGYRLLGTVHISAPFIPLLLTWPSDEDGLACLEKAYTMAPENLYNRVYLAFALHANDQPERARSLLIGVINEHTRIHDVAIDASVKKEAQEYLNKNF